MSAAVNYAWPVTSINDADYQAFMDWKNRNENLMTDGELAIWGAGIRGTEFSVFLKRCDFKRFYFVDSNSQKWGGMINEFPIISPDELDERVKNGKTVMLVSTEESKNIEEYLKKKGYVYNKDFFVIKSNLYDKYVDEFKRTYTNDILIVGDCEFSAISLHDADDRNLGEMIWEKCGRERIKILTMHGMGLRAYYNIIKAQIEIGMIPEILFVMINFDTLTGKQHLLPRSQHTELIKRIYALSKKENGEFAKYVELVDQRSKNIQAEFLTSNQSKPSMVNYNAKARNYFRLNYMYDLDVNTEGLVYLNKIFQEAKSFDINVLPFIPPVNYMFAETLLGEKFLEKYRENLDKVKKIVADADLRLLDFSFLLTPDMFAEPDTPDETANEIGRKKMADIFAKNIDMYFNR